MADTASGVGAHRQVGETALVVFDIAPRSDDPLIEAVVNRLPSDHTKRAYRRALIDFMQWYVNEGRPPLAYQVVTRYIQFLRSEGKSAQSINQRLAAIRTLAREAAAIGLLAEGVATSIKTVKGEKVRGARIGQWLTREQAQALLELPDARTLRGARDRALLATLLGSGLRRSEMVTLTYAHVQQRDGRWVFVDIRGKGNRVRSVPIASWVKVAIDAWREAAHLTESAAPVFQPLVRGGKLRDVTVSSPLTDQTIHDIVAVYSQRLGVDFAPHDLRRTYAKLARKGGAALEQIQLSLGHASVQTTEHYVGMDQDFSDAPGDRLGLTLNRRKGK